MRSNFKKGFQIFTKFASEKQCSNKTYVFISLKSIEN